MSIDIVQVNEHEEKIEEKGYKKYKLIDTQNSENKRNDIKENIWKIVSYIKASEEKKALTKIMKENTKRKSKKTMKRI